MAQIPILLFVSPCTTKQPAGGGNHNISAYKTNINYVSSYVCMDEI